MEHVLDIQGVPRRYFFELLSHFTTSELEKEKLQEFCSAEGQVLGLFKVIVQKKFKNCSVYFYDGNFCFYFQEELYSYCYRQKRTALEVGWFYTLPYE